MGAGAVDSLHGTCVLCSSLHVDKTSQRLGRISLSCAQSLSRNTPKPEHTVTRSPASLGYLISGERDKMGIDRIQKYTPENKGSKRWCSQWCHRRTIAGSPKNLEIKMVKFGKFRWFKIFLKNVTLWNAEELQWWNENANETKIYRK